MGPYRKGRPRGHVSAFKSASRLSERSHTGACALAHVRAPVPWWPSRDPWQNLILWPKNPPQNSFQCVYKGRKIWSTKVDCHVSWSYAITELEAVNKRSDCWKEITEISPVFCTVPAITGLMEAFVTGSDMHRNQMFCNARPCCADGSETLTIKACTI